MNNFKMYPSNTYAGTSNNFIMARDGEVQNKKTSRLFYRVIKPGKFGYKFCFSNSVDSTYQDGSRAVANVLGGEWKLSMKVGVGAEYGDFSQDIELSDVTFDGKLTKITTPGEVFWSDEIEIDVIPGRYLVVELTFLGSMIPYTPNKIIPSFSFDGNNWVEDAENPNPVIVGALRPVKRRIAFMGDSITQGLGTNVDKYEFWVAEIGRGLGEEYSICDCGLGDAKAYDAASKGGWLERLKNFETVFVCFGVNDIFSRRTPEQISLDIETVVDELHSAGCKVGLLSTPPFDFEGDLREVWYSLCGILKDKLSKKCEYYFDTSSALGLDAPNRHMAKYGGHPDKRGGAALGKAFCEYLKENGYEL